MSNTSKSSALILGLSLIIGLGVLGNLLADAAIRVKEFDRTVTVKGLSEREYPADIVIWPVQFTEASNDLTGLYEAIEGDKQKIIAYLKDNGIRAEEISFTPPSITDKSAQRYGNQPRAPFRYTSTQTVTVYSSDIDTVRNAMRHLSELGRQGIVFNNENYDAKPEYLFTHLNEVKPAMIEEATKKAREVAEKFAADSNSVLGKIKRASQGQFSINNRDRNNPHIKKVRVVSTVVYYLSD